MSAKGIIDKINAFIDAMGLEKSTDPILRTLNKINGLKESFESSLLSKTNDPAKTVAKEIIISQE